MSVVLTVVHVARSVGRSVASSSGRGRKRKKKGPLWQKKVARCLLLFCPHFADAPQLFGSERETAACTLNFLESAFAILRATRCSTALLLKTKGWLSKMPTSPFSKERRKKALMDLLFLSFSSCPE